MLRVILLTIIFSFIILPQSSQNKNDKISGDEQVMQKDLKNSEEKTDLKLERLENKIDDNYRELKNESQIRQDSIELRMAIYVAAIIGFFTLVGFLINFFGRKAIKQRVETIVQEKAEKYAEEKLDEEIKKKITNEFVSKIIEEKGKKAMGDLIKRLEKEGKDILEDHQKQYNKALSELEKLKDDYSKEPTEEKKEKVAEFSKMVDKVKTEENFTAEDWFWKAYNAHQKKEYKLAIEYFDKSISLKPNNKFAYNYRGVIYDDLKDYPKAIIDYSKAIDIDPKFSPAYNNRGLAQTKLKDYQKAIADYKKSIEINPNNFFAYYNRGILYEKLEDYQTALENYNKAIEINPRYSDAYNNRGFIHYVLKDYQKAIENYNKAIQYSTDDVIAYHNLIELYITQNNFIEAEKVLWDCQEKTRGAEREIIGIYLLIITTACLGKDISSYQKEFDHLLNSVQHMNFILIFKGLIPRRLRREVIIFQE